MAKCNIGFVVIEDYAYRNLVRDSVKLGTIENYIARKLKSEYHIVDVREVAELLGMEVESIGSETNED